MSLDHYNYTPSLRYSRNPYSSAHFLPAIKSTKRHPSLRYNSQRLLSTQQSVDKFNAPAEPNAVSNAAPSKRLLGSVWATVRNLDLLSVTAVADTNEDTSHATNRGSDTIRSGSIQQEARHNLIGNTQAISSSDVAKSSEPQLKETRENFDNNQKTNYSIPSNSSHAPDQQQGSISHVQDLPRSSSKSQIRASSALSNATSLASTAGYNADTEVRYSSTYSRTSEESFEEYRQYISKSAKSRITKHAPTKSLIPGSVLSINSLYHEYVRDLADPVAEHDGSSQSTPHTLIGDANSLTWNGLSAIKHDLITVPEFTINPSDLQLPTQTEYLKEQEMLPSFSARVKAYQAKGDAAYKAMLEPTFTEDWISHLDEEVHTHKQYNSCNLKILDNGAGFSLHDGPYIQCRPSSPLSTPNLIPDVTTQVPYLPGQKNPSLRRTRSRALSKGSSSSVSSDNKNGQLPSLVSVVKQSLPVLTVSPPKSPPTPVSPTVNTDITSTEPYRTKRRQTYSLSSIPELAMLSLAFCQLSEAPVVDSIYTEPDTEDPSLSATPFQQQLPIDNANHVNSTGSPNTKDERLQTHNSPPPQLADDRKQELSQANLHANHDIKAKPDVLPELNLNPSLNLDLNLSVEDLIPRRSPSAPPQLNSPTIRLRHKGHSRSISNHQHTAHPLHRTLTNPLTPPPEESTDTDISPATPEPQERASLSLPTHLKSLLQDSCPFPAPIQRSRFIPRHIRSSTWLKDKPSRTDLSQTSNVTEATQIQDKIHNQAQSQVKHQIQARSSSNSSNSSTKPITSTGNRNSNGKSNLEPPAVVASDLDLLAGNTSATHSWTEVWAGQGDPYEHLASDTGAKRDRDRERFTMAEWKGRQRERVRGMLRGVLRRV